MRDFFKVLFTDKALDPDFFYMHECVLREQTFDLFMTAGAIYIAFSYNASIRDFSEYIKKNIKIKRTNKSSLHLMDQRDAKFHPYSVEH